MQQKRYQVFISSTFSDLGEERRAVQDVVISNGDFPVQMESFPAADEDQFDFIKSLIDQCDYYVLIIAGRYGTVAKDGLSYTHKEFRYAASKGVPVLVILHGDSGTIAVEKSEKTDAGKKLLADFIDEVQIGRLRKTWTTLDGLKLAVREALDHAKATKPRVGWIRGDSVTSLETLEELNVVRKENEKFRDILGSLEIEVPLPSIPKHDDPLEIDLLPLSVGRGNSKTTGSAARIRSTWISVFPLFYSGLDWNSDTYEGGYMIDSDATCIAIGSALAGEVASFDTSRLFEISRGSLERLKSYYTEVGLMADDADSPFTEHAQKVARRFLISGDYSTDFVVIDGAVQLLSSSRELDDDIPF
ncbi:uncharacterized protein DUF4062 [Hoeflea marina]|uniref:Uncharacterized protein DUF4062 n=1 Tax=Hoeflea marina TaxID=274592 RepID=A0A317PLF6_9HYPH|nr:DUF4062 domain-containing protein [Hoeflea marina]PWV99856.1 uncharacterized protein DUF4062 [Hoeflea marina]